MYINSIISKLVDQYDDFTDTEKIIADYFLKNKKMDDFSIKNMKRKIFVSEASLSRFAQKMGFRGYREFVYEYSRIFTTPQDKDYSSSSVINVYEQILNRFNTIIDTAQIERLIQYLKEYDHIHVVGIASSGLAGEEMKRRFTRLGVLMESCSEGDLMKIQSLLMNQRNLVIGISISGTSDEVVFALKHAHERKARTVLITGNTEKKEYVDELVCIPVLENLDTGNIISPQFPILVFIDLLYNSYLNENQNTLKLQKETVEILKGK